MSALFRDSGKFGLLGHKKGETTKTRKGERCTREDRWGAAVYPARPYLGYKPAQNDAIVSARKPSAAAGSLCLPSGIHHALLNEVPSCPGCCSLLSGKVRGYATLLLFVYVGLARAIDNAGRRKHNSSEQHLLRLTTARQVYLCQSR